MELVFWSYVNDFGGLFGVMSTPIEIKYSYIFGTVLKTNLPLGAAGSSQLQPIPLLPTASPEKRLQAPQKFKKSRRPKKPLRSTRYFFYPTCFKESLLD